MDKRLFDPRYEMEHVVLPDFFYSSPKEFFGYAKEKNVPYDCYKFVCDSRFKEVQYNATQFSIKAELVNDIKFCSIDMPQAEKNFDCVQIFTASDIGYELYFILEYEHVILPGNVNPNPSDLTLYYITVDGTKECLKRIVPEDDVKSIILDFFKQDL